MCTHGKAAHDGVDGGVESNDDDEEERDDDREDAEFEAESDKPDFAMGALRETRILGTVEKTGPEVLLPCDGPAVGDLVKGAREGVRAALLDLTGCLLGSGANLRGFDGASKVSVVLKEDPTSGVRCSDGPGSWWGDGVGCTSSKGKAAVDAG